MKRYLRVLPALALAAWLLAACGDNATPTQPSTTQTATTSAATNTAPSTTTASSVTTSAATTTVAITAPSATSAGSVTSVAIPTANPTTNPITTASAISSRAATTAVQATAGSTQTTAAATNLMATVPSGTTAASAPTTTPVVGGQVGTSGGDLPIFANFKPVTLPAEFTRLFEQYFAQNFKAANAASATHQLKYYSNTNSPQTVEKFYDTELGKLGYTKSPAGLNTGVKLASLNLNVYNMTYTKRNGSADQIVTIDSLGPITDENLSYFASSNLPDISTIIVVDQAVVPHS